MLKVTSQVTLISIPIVVLPRTPPKRARDRTMQIALPRKWVGMQSTSAEVANGMRTPGRTIMSVKKISTKVGSLRAFSETPRTKAIRMCKAITYFLGKHCSNREDRMKQLI